MPKFITWQLIVLAAFLTPTVYFSVAYVSDKFFEYWDNREEQEDEY